jgi:DNA-binding MarR family transcriptional regulator
MISTDVFIFMPNGFRMHLHQETFHLLRLLFQQHTARWQHTFPELTKPQYSVLRAVAEHPGIEQARLTEAAVCTKATLAEMLSRMEKKGWVSRACDLADKRRRFVSLTPDGQALLTLSQSRATTVDQAFLTRLNQQEQQAFNAMIEKMLEPDGNART